MVADRHNKKLDISLHLPPLPLPYDYWEDWTVILITLQILNLLDSMKQSRKMGAYMSVNCIID